MSGTGSSQCEQVAIASDESGESDLPMEVAQALFRRR